MKHISQDCQVGDPFRLCPFCSFFKNTETLALFWVVSWGMSLMTKSINWKFSFTVWKPTLHLLFPAGNGIIFWVSNQDELNFSSIMKILVLNHDEHRWSHILDFCCAFFDQDSKTLYLSSRWQWIWGCQHRAAKWWFLSVSWSRWQLVSREIAWNNSVSVYNVCPLPIVHTYGCYFTSIVPFWSPL